MKKVFWGCYIVLLVILLKLVFSFVINEVFISKYNSGNYDEGLVKKLFIMNFSEQYIAYYNYGNLLYKINDYDKAILEYNKALEKNPSEDRVCAIRINLALAMVKDIDLNLTAEEQVNLLKEAREVLYIDNCASEEDESGKSEEAEYLEEEIKELEKEKSGETDSESGEDDESGDDESGKDDKEQDEKQKELEERNKGESSR